MAASLTSSDWLGDGSGLEAVEEGGAWKSLTREFLIENLTNTDFNALSEALGVSGVPTALSAPAAGSNLIVARRKVQILGSSSNRKARVTIEYADKGDAGFSFTFRGQASLEQQTNVNDYYGTQITTQHTYPADDPNHAGQTETLGGEVNVLYPRVTLEATGILARAYPHFEAFAWAARLNSTSWAGSGARTWRCGPVTFDPHDMAASPKEWRYHFVFTYNAEGWDPEVVHRDPYTGRPPSNLVAGVGWKQVRSYPLRDFNELFPL